MKEKVRMASNSIIASPLAGESAPAISELPTLLRQWMKLQEEVSVLNAELKQRQTQSKALKSVILRIMETNKVAALNVSKGTVVHKISEKAEGLSTSFLMKHCKDFFQGDEDRARALLTYLEEHRSVKKAHDLKLQAPKGGDDDSSRRS
jgi:hypothetical protein